MKISISSRLRTDGTDNPAQVIEVSQEFEEQLLDIITSTTTLGEDFLNADRSESTLDGEIVVRFTLLLTPEKNSEFSVFAERLAMAFADLFLKDFFGHKQEVVS
jgi:hypothetical protein